MSDTEVTMYPVEIAKAIIAVKKQVKQLGVDDNNKHGGYPFVSVDKFYERFGKLMAEAGIALLIDETGSEIKAGGKEGNAWLFAHYELRFVHESGVVSPSLRRSLAMPISGPQAYGAAQSYIEKQFLRQVFKIPTGEKDADDMAQDDTPPPRQAPRDAGMVRAADVPPSGAVNAGTAQASGNGTRAQTERGQASSTGTHGPTATTPASRSNGNGDATMSVEQRAAIFREEMMARFAKCKLPADVGTIIKNNGKALDGLKKMAPDVYDEIMAESNRITNEMYASA